MTNLEYALQYLKRGWSVIPIKEGSKLPAIKSWTKFQTQLPTEDEVTDWYEAYPNAGIALICGKVSGVFAVDIDIPHGGSTDGLNLPITLVSNTGGGGHHYLYKWRHGLIGAKVGLRQGIDIRSDNSYIVLPPTLHASGKNYEWANEDEELEVAPEWLEEVKQKHKEKTDWKEFFNKNNGEGLRNMSASKVAGKIMYDMSPETWNTLGLMAFKEWNRIYNNPSLGDKELMTTWESIQKTHLKNNKPQEKTNEVDVVDEEAVLKLYNKNKTKGTYFLAKLITKKFDIITVGEKEHEMFVYRDGIYFQAENEIIYPEMQNIIGEDITRAAKGETFNKICDMTAKSRSIFESAPLNFIPLSNGVYDMETDTLVPHSSGYKFKYKFPIKYDGGAQCPKTIAFFNQVLSEEQLLTVQEWIGYYFYRSYMFKKAIVFVGEGDTGKTTLLETIIHLIGIDNISSVSLQKLSSDKFSAAHLYEKHANIVDELSARDIADTGNFKVATGGGSITGEYKFGNQFSFHNFSKFTFACNKIPDVTDFDDLAYFNRWIVIRFENTITKKIPNFVNTLRTEEERSGLFNWAMVGLKRLLDNGGFTYANDADETKMEMMRSSSSAGEFIAKCIKQDVGKEITKEDMYDEYTAFCTENKLSVATKKSFGMKFVTLKYVSDGLIYDGGKKRVEGWRNVSVIKTEKKVEEEKEADKKFNDF
jgi:P4 family phage/plasmid primase-like protien